MNYVLKAEGTTVRVSPFAFNSWANDYYDCAANFVPHGTWSPVPYALLCRSIELKLKSHHLKECTQEDARIKFGHDLVKSFQALPKGTIELSDTELKLLTSINAIYAKKGFDYVSIGDMCTACERFPELEGLRKLTLKILAR